MTTQQDFTLLRVLDITLSALWRLKGRLALAVVAIWWLEFQQFQLQRSWMAAGHLWVAWCAPYLTLQAARMVLVPGIHHQLAGGGMTLTRLPSLADCRAVFVRALCVVAVFFICTVLFILFCRTIDFLLGFLHSSSFRQWTNGDFRAARAMSFILMLGFDAVFFLHLPVAALESRGILSTFHRSNALLSGRRATILRLLVLFGFLGPAQMDAPSADEAMAGALSDAVYVTIMAVLTTVCYSEVTGVAPNGRRQESERRRLYVFPVLRESVTIFWSNGRTLTLVAVGFSLAFLVVDLTVKGLRPLTYDTPQSIWFLAQLVFLIEAMRVSLVNIATRTRTGDSIRLGDMWGLVMQALRSERRWTILGVTLLKDGVLLLALAVAAVTMRFVPSQELVVLVATAVIVLVQVLAVRLFVVIPVACLDGRSVWSSIVSGDQLTSGRRWDLWRLILTMDGLLSFVVVVPAGLLLDSFLSSEVARAVVAVVGRAAIALVYAVVTTVTYWRLKELVRLRGDSSIDTGME